MPPGARILVTGAAGFVGGHLRDALRMAFGDARLIAAIHRRPAMGWDESVTLNLADAAGLAQANVAQSFQDVAATWEANLTASLNLGAALMRARPACRLLFASTGEIYGLSFQQGVALDENAPLAPGNPYAAAKAAADIALGEMALRGLAVIRMRPLNHVGPGQSEGYAVAAFARQIALIEAGRQAPVMAVGALERWRDFLDVRDVCAAYAQALAQWERLPNGVALNIASGVPRRIGDVLAGLLARSDRVIRVEEAAHALRPNDVIRSLGDAGRAHAMLGWQPMIDWETTLDDVLADWRARV
ncbi:MAG: NAD-dependent epimerase/dehydratase family protein [Alphaproteobacteria bacterium]|nr:NAD-dependent epimerase/dehydratase family protein [Alphaproteobacteria bacterium]